MNLDKITYLYKQAYLNLPPSAKKFIGTLYGNIPLHIRFGEHYSIHKKIVTEFETWDKEKQLEFIFNKTLETVNFAITTIPYYKQLCQEANLTINSFQEMNDFAKIPPLTKELIQEHLDELYTDSRHTPVRQLTGGSTFSPTEFYLPLEVSRGKEKAYVDYIFGRLGYKHRDKMVQFRDRRIEHQNKYWEHETVDNHLVISANHIGKEYIEHIVEEINRFKPKFFYGYPSSISRFVKLCNRMSLSINNPIDGVFLISENALKSDIEVIKNFFACQVLAHYGHSERCSVGYSIDGGAYRFLDSYGLTQIVNNEIVTTSFDNFVMPLINYRLKDYVGGDIEFYQNTDVAYSVDRIEGRLQEFLVDKNKKLISATQLPYGSYDKYENIEGIQFYQESVGSVMLKIQTDLPEEIATDEILNEFKNFFGDGFDINIQCVQQLEKTPRGKSMIVIQKLDTGEYLND